MRKIPVPILKQTKMSCGPTCIAMILAYYKDKKPLTEIIRGVGGIKSYGVMVIKLAEYARGIGYKVDCFSYDKELAKGQAKIVKPSTKLILRYLEKRIPVILSVRSFLLWNKKFDKEGHAIVITKYQNGKFWYNDPYIAKEVVINESDLLFAWHNNILKSSAYMLALKPKNNFVLK